MLCHWKLGYLVTLPTKRTAGLWKIVEGRIGVVKLLRVVIPQYGDARAITVAQQFVIERLHGRGCRCCKQSAQVLEYAV